MILNQETMIGLSKIEKALYWMIPPILGAVLGWFLPVIAEWVLTIPIVLLKGPLEFITSLNSFWVSVIAAVIGIIAGLFFSQYIFNEILKVFISDQNVRLLFKEKEEIIEKKDISTVYLENKDLVILGDSGNELYREQIESKKALVESAFKNHGYKWKEEDPFKNQYERWVADHPDFPSHINTLLLARERAMLENKHEEAKILRKDLAKLGVVIQDESKRQYVRMVS
ncbi:YqeB family protein [Bacillus swezeyi]|uniref:YqeB family protein n=1 Tax=Bacillus swezeyi TaxID=1925020 RepID=UPI0026991AA8